MRPLVQIGVSIYGQSPSQVKECIESAINQTFKEKLVTVRIDGPDSCDHETRDWLLSLSDSRKDIRVEVGENRLGIYGSYNHLFKKTRSPFLCQLDADDFLHKNAIEVLCTALINQPDLVMCFSDCVEVDIESIPIQMRSKGPCNTSPFALLSHFYTYHLRMIRRNAFDQIGGYDESFLWASDYDLCLKLNELGPIQHKPLPLYNYRVHDSSASQQFKKEVYHESLIAVKSALRRRKLTNDYDASVNLESGEISVHRLSKKQPVESNIFYISPIEYR